MMPAGVGEPQMGPMSTGLGEVYQFEIRGAGYSPMALRRLLQWTVAPKLKLTPGVADVNIYGGQMPTYEVQVSAEALRPYGVTMAPVYNALGRNLNLRSEEHTSELQSLRHLVFRLLLEKKKKKIKKTPDDSSGMHAHRT